MNQCTLNKDKYRVITHKISFQIKNFEKMKKKPEYTTIIEKLRFLKVDTFIV